jgi:hypothetical protein
MKRISDRRGDAVMVTTVLMLSIILSVGGRLLLDYGEIVGKDDDMVHAADVSDSLMSVRSSMGTLLRSGDTESRILNRVTLGTFGNPYLGVARSSGTLDYSPDPDSFQMSVYLEDGGNERLLNTISGSLTFTSNNFYYHDQTFLFQGGGIVLDEYGFRAMSTNPTSDVSRTPTGWTYSVILFSLTGSQWSISGIESVALNIGMAGLADLVLEPSAGQVVSLRINCPGEEAWEDHFRNDLVKNGLVENTDFIITQPADWNSTSDYLEVELQGMERFVANIGEMEVSL